MGQKKTFRIICKITLCVAGLVDPEFRLYQKGETLLRTGGLGIVAGKKKATLERVASSFLTQKD
jgi:hypothetical protein